jgi:uncharacterized damage-inducible protein DinB
MINPDNINSLLMHMKWADAEVWKKVLTFKAAENDERIKKLLYHIHQVQYAFYSLWIDHLMEIPKLDTFKNLESITKWCADYQKKLDEYLLSSTEDLKDRIINIPWSIFMERRTGKKVVPATLEETMLQVALHSTYHRAQVNIRLRELGGEPPSVDFIVWVWLGKPKADWDNLF